MTQSREPPSPLLDSIEANKSKRRQRASAVAVVSLVEFALILLSYGILSFCAGRLVQRALTYPPTQNLAPLENTTGNISFEKGLVRVHDHNARHVVTTVGRYSRSVPQTWVHSVHRSTAQSMLSTRFLEALVHPALLVHDNPVHALVVCDDPAACSLILNEVRQHTNTVESVVTFLTPLIALARDTTSQCLLQSDGTTVSALSSVDSTFLQFQWDKDAYGSRQARRQSTNQSCIVEKDSLDVVLVARLPINVDMHTLYRLVYQSLRADGVFAMALDAISNPAASRATVSRFAETMALLETVGYESIVDYAESFRGHQQAFVVAMKSSNSRASWFMNEAEFNVRAVKRSSLAASSAAETRASTFDAAAMMQYQFTSRLVENHWCRHMHLQGRPISEHGACGDESTTIDGSSHGMNPDIANNPIADFEVRPSQIANGGRGVFATKPVSKSTFLAMEEKVHIVVISSRTYNLLDYAAEVWNESISDYWDVLYWGYIEGYGWVTGDYGPHSALVEPSIMTFCNHGCNGTYNRGAITCETERTAMISDGPATNCVRYRTKAAAYNPWQARHFPLSSRDDSGNMALYNIEAGEEVLDNFLAFGVAMTGEVSFWNETVSELKPLCAGESMGWISTYEGHSNFNATAIDD